MSMPMPKIPQYFKDLPSKANLTAHDIAKILGYKLSNSIYDLAALGKFPQPDSRFRCGSMQSLGINKGRIGHERIFWHKSTVEKYIKDLNNAGK